MNPHQTLLTNREKIRKIKQISQSAKDDVLEPFIRSAQMLDIKPLLGDKLYFDLLKDPTAHELLMNGGDYIFQDEAMYFCGLETVISVYSYGRYIMFGSYRDTPFGHETKTNPYAVPTDDKVKGAIWNDSRKEAFAYWQEVEKFLELTEYPLFRTSCCEPKNNMDNGMVWTAVKKG